MPIIKTLQEAASLGLTALYEQLFTESDFQVNQTRPEFEGDYTVVLFSLVKILKKSSDIIGNELGEHLIKNHSTIFSKYNVIKGFLNITISEEYLLNFLQQNFSDTNFGRKKLNGKKIMVEYSSPNTNKPLHLGHLRNNFIGWSIAEILKANGNDVIKTCIVNDRGIHICKSMLAWQLFSNGETPQSTHTKGDHFVGDYYVKFNDEYKKQVSELMSLGKTKEEAEKEAPLMKAAQKMLLDWENNEPETRSLWKKMNSWVYDGFEITYKRIGSDFDKVYYESETYLLGKDFVQEGLEKQILYKKGDARPPAPAGTDGDDPAPARSGSGGHSGSGGRAGTDGDDSVGQAVGRGSIWIDLTEEGLDEKLLLRADGTSVYITSDIGLAKQKYEQYKPHQSIYVVGDEQNYHFQVLYLVCKKLGMPFAQSIYHLSYGMVELPSGKMKSREGTVVDADDLIDEMIITAKRHTEELGKVKDFTEEELTALFEILGMGAMKFYLLRVEPKKRMIFNPEESIDFHGFTGPFVQYTFARIQSILRKVEEQEAATLNPKPQTQNPKPETRNPKPETQNPQTNNSLFPLEKQLILALEQFPVIIEQAAEELNPSVVANYIFHLAKTFNSFYTEHSIVNAENLQKKHLRLNIAKMTANIIGSGMNLLGIKMPYRM